MFLGKIKSYIRIIRFFITPSFWEPFSNIRIFRSIHGISKPWIFRQSLALQANLSRKEKRSRSLGNFYEFGHLRVVRGNGKYKKVYYSFKRA